MDPEQEVSTMEEYDFSGDPCMEREREREVLMKTKKRVVGANHCPMVADTRSRHYIWDGEERKTLALLLRPEDRLEIPPNRSELEEDVQEIPERDETPPNGSELEGDVQEIPERDETPPNGSELEGNVQEIPERDETPPNGSELEGDVQEIPERDETQANDSELQRELEEIPESDDTPHTLQLKVSVSEERIMIRPDEERRRDRLKRLRSEIQGEADEEEDLLSSGEEYQPTRDEMKEFEEEDMRDLEADDMRELEEDDMREETEDVEEDDRMAEDEGEVGPVERKRRPHIRVVKGESKRKRFECRVEGCTAKVVNLPRHMRQVHGEESTTAESDKKRRMYFGMKACPICETTTIRMDLHLIRQHKMERESEAFRLKMKEAVGKDSRPEEKTDLERAFDEYSETMQGRSTGKARKQTTAQHNRTAVRAFISNLDKREVESLLRIGDRGGKVSEMLEEKKLSASSIQVYVHALVAFIEFLAGTPHWVRHLSMTSVRLREIAERVRTIARSLKEDINREEVERHSRGDKSLKVEEWMLGAYFQGMRPIRCAELLEKAESYGLTPAEAVEVRDIICVMLIISNARRPGDIGHLLMETVEGMEVPQEEDAMTEIYIAEHKEAKSGKICPLTLSKDMAIHLKNYAEFVRDRNARCPYFFLTRKGTALTASSMSKVVSTEWGRFRKEVGVDLPHLTASINRKVAVTSIREAGGSREDQETLARHMAHNVQTADRYYDKATKKDKREAILKTLKERYVDAAHKS